VALGFVAIAFLDTTFIMLAVVATFVFVGGMYEERAFAAHAPAGRRAGDLADTTRQVFAATERIDTVFPHLHVARRRLRNCGGIGRAGGRGGDGGRAGAVRAGHRASRWPRLRATTFPWRSEHGGGARLPPPAEQQHHAAW
jgi:hypothetical protein